MTHAKLITISLGDDSIEKVVLPWVTEEHLLSMGEPVYEGLGGKDYGPSSFQNHLSNMNSTFMKHAAGNSFHVMEMGLFMLYCFNRLELWHRAT